MTQMRWINLGNGRHEVLRVLSPEEISTWSAGDRLSYERSILWLEDLSRIPFVRVAEVRCARSRRGRLVIRGPEQVIGYAKLLSDAPRDPRTQAFCRRLFYLKPEDRGAVIPPPGAIDPRTVLPGHSGNPPDVSSLRRQISPPVSPRAHGSAGTIRR